MRQASGLEALNYSWTIIGRTAKEDVQVSAEVQEDLCRTLPSIALPEQRKDRVSPQVFSCPIRNQLRVRRDCDLRTLRQLRIILDQLFQEGMGAPDVVQNDMRVPERG